MINFAVFMVAALLNVVVCGVAFNLWASLAAFLAWLAVFCAVTELQEFMRQQVDENKQERR